jgi:hypothetical protein
LGGRPSKGSAKARISSAGHPNSTWQVCRLQQAVSDAYLKRTSARAPSFAARRAALGLDVGRAELGLAAAAAATAAAASADAAFSAL